MMRITLFFIAGVLSGIYFPGVLSATTGVLFLVVLIAIFFTLRFVSRKSIQPIACGVIGLTAVALAGYLHVAYQTDSRWESHLLNQRDTVTAYKAIVRQVPEKREKVWRAEVEVVAVKTTCWQKTRGNVLLYLPRTEARPDWEYGDEVLIKGTPQQAAPPLNPGEFDFRRFLGFRHIYHQHFISHNQVAVIAGGNDHGIIYYSQRARWWAVRQLSQYVKGEQEQAVAGALLLGVTEGIDDDLQNAFAASGTLHVLSVSGLHVGVIYAIILFLFRPLRSVGGSQWIVAGVSVVCLWVFAFVTGLSPSVLRAVTMFSFLAIAKPLGRRNSIYNSLASSALILLLYDPYFIMSVGFQLSYLAVLGIVYWQKPIYGLWTIENKVGDWIWQITCVSLAAQLATLPFTLLYFHQFPVYFLLSNLLVIPLSTGILTVSLLLLLVSFLPALAAVIGGALQVMIELLNRIVVLTEQLPLSVIDRIYITPLQGALLIALLISIALLFEYRSAKWLVAGAAVTIAFTVLQWVHFNESVKRKEWIVYAIKGHSAMEWLQNGHSYFAGDSLLTGDKKKIHFHIEPNRLKRGISNSEGASFKRNYKGIVAYHYGSKLVLSMNKRNLLLPEALEADYVIVSNNAIPAAKLGMQVHAGVVILDGSNSRSFVHNFIAQSKQYNITVYDVMDRGAFIQID